MITAQMRDLGEMNRRLRLKRRTYSLLHEARAAVVAIQQNLGYATLKTTLSYTVDH